MTKPRYRTSCVSRFLKYVTIDTQSREDSESFPSSPGQLDLLELLAREAKMEPAEFVKRFEGSVNGYSNGS